MGKEGQAQPAQAELHVEPLGACRIAEIAMELGRGATRLLDGDREVAEGAAGAAEYRRVRALGTPGDAERAVVDGQHGVAHRHLGEIAEGAAAVGRRGEVAQQACGPVARGGCGAAKAEPEGAVFGTLQPQLRPAQNDDRRRDPAGERRAQAEAERQFR
jgi:hypothetical protein